VLPVLKLAILLRDSVPVVMALIWDTHRLLEVLKKVTVGHISCSQILQTSVEKCEAALKEFVASETTAGVAESNFQGYVPSELVFEWDSPGLKLKHMPLRWQDYFINIDGLF
jgi:hypothetical protein